MNAGAALVAAELGPVQLDAVSDLGLARRLVAEHGDDLRYAPQLGVWLAWDGRRWAEDLTGEAFRRAKLVVDDVGRRAVEVPDDKEKAKAVKAWLSASGAQRIRGTVTLAATEPGVPVLVDELDADPWLLNASNGTIDLRTAELRPHRRADLLTKVAGAAYRPDAPAPNWERFLASVFDGDTEVIGFVQRLVGYACTGTVQEHVLAIPTGAGANGKSTLLNAFTAVLGDYATAVDPRLLLASDRDEHPTILTDLRGARFVSTVELDAGRRLAEATVKAITGGDTIAARRMRGDYFRFMPSHTVFMATNHLPRISGTDEGIWRRILVVPFNRTFTGTDRDPNLPAKLAAEADGILAWCVRGCLAWQRRGLDPPDAVTLSGQRYRDREDHVGRFLADCATLGDHENTMAKTLRATYESWCDEQGERPWTAKSLGAELSKRGLDNHRTKVGMQWIGVAMVHQPNATTSQNANG